MKLNERIAALRQQRNLTQRELANQCGWSHTTIALFETGDREPNVAKRAKLAEVLGVPLIDLLPPEAKPLPKSVIVTERELVRLIVNYRRLTPAARKAMLTAVQSVATIPRFRAPAKAP